jgi:hypothetical protein
MTREVIEPKYTRFKAVFHPGGEVAFVPDDLHILIPKAPRIAPEDRHYLAYLPWKPQYLSHVPEAYREFFTFVLPFLHARTSNVHTALSIGQLPYLLKDTTRQLDERLMYLALILHDSGWSQVSQRGILHSLSYHGVSPSSEASMKPKQQHLIYGEALAYKLLDAFDFGNNPLTSDEIYTITEIIRRHDHDAAWEQGKYGAIKEEVRIVCDSDRLWSYTHENFWLDTVRKGVPPEAYLQSISDEIPRYFFTAQGKARAGQMIARLKPEVAAYANLMQNPELRAELLLKSRNPSKRLVYRTKQVLLSAKSRRLQRAIIRQNAL